MPSYVSTQCLLLLLLYFLSLPVHHRPLLLSRRLAIRFWCESARRSRSGFSFRFLVIASIIRVLGLFRDLSVFIFPLSACFISCPFALQACPNRSGNLLLIMIHGLLYGFGNSSFHLLSKVFKVYWLNCCSKAFRRIFIANIIDLFSSPFVRNHV